MDVDEEIPLKDRGNTVDTTDQTNQTDDQETGFGGGDLLTDQHTDGDTHSTVPSVFDLDTSIGQLEDGGGAELRSAMESRQDRQVREREVVLEELLGFRPKVHYGKYSERLLLDTKVRRGGGGGGRGRIIGMEFDGGNVIKVNTSRGAGGYVWSDSTNDKMVLNVKLLKRIAAKAKKEYEKESLRASIARIEGTSGEDIPMEDLGADSSEVADPVVLEDLDPGASTSVEGAAESLVTDAVVEEVSDSAADVLLTRIQIGNDEIEQGFVNLKIPYDDWRESKSIFKAGILSQEGSTPTERMEWMDREIKHWGDKAVAETDPDINDLYETVVISAKMTKDYIRMRVGLKPEFEDTMVILKEAIDTSDELRLERFKRWANIVGLSAIAISAAGLITGIVMASRSALKAGAKGLGKFAGALARVLKKLGPVFAALGSLVSTALSWGAKGILWMANNLWFLVIMVLAALYAEYGRRRSAK